MASVGEGRGGDGGVPPPPRAAALRRQGESDARAGPGTRLLTGRDIASARGGTAGAAAHNCWRAAQRLSQTVPLPAMDSTHSSGNWRGSECRNRDRICGSKTCLKIGILPVM